jgi:hypothetical protein
MKHAIADAGDIALVYIVQYPNINGFLYFGSKIRRSGVYLKLFIEGGNGKICQSYKI